MSAVEKIRTLSGRAVSLRGNDIDTDRIIPARFLKEITFARMGEYPFFDERFTPEGEPKDHPFNAAENQGASLLVVNENFGCGSSREHAPQALKRWGIRAVIAESLAEIFAGNCSMIGLAAVTMAAGALGEVQRMVEADPARELTLDLAAETLVCGEKRWEISLPAGRKKALLEGSWNSTALLLENLPQARKTAAALPYMGNFSA